MLVGTRPTLRVTDGNAQGARHAYSNVLQELAYALLGITGDVFIDDRPPVSQGEVLPANRSMFHLTSEASWISDAEREEINTILELGFHYAEIDRFVQRNQRPLDTVSKQGVWQALAMGLEGTHRLAGAVIGLTSACLEPHLVPVPATTHHPACPRGAGTCGLRLCLDVFHLTASHAFERCRALRGLSSGHSTCGAAPHDVREPNARLHLSLPV